MSELKQNQPMESKQFDRVQAAIWQQESKLDTKNAKLYTFSVSRSFKTDQGEWRRTHSFTPRDLPHVLLAVNWAMDQLLMKAE
jgi:hypothetical protein